jgi:hypothetical protein
MSAKINTLYDLQKDLQNNFVELKIVFRPTEHQPEWIEVRKEGWGETTIHISLHPDCISILGFVAGKSDSYEPRPLSPEVQDCVNRIKAHLEPSNTVVVTGPASIGSISRS